MASPDVPANVCYFIVTAVGMVVAFSKTNRLIASSPGRWRFGATWLLFAAYSVVPVVLFWFLDYTHVLHDTSVFAALLVAVGYRQILSGEMQGVAAPSQFSRFWSPFETWAGTVRDQILERTKIISDRLADKTIRHLSEDPERVHGLAQLAYELTPDPAASTALANDLAAIAATQKPSDLTDAAFAALQTRRRVERALRAVRLAAPQDYGDRLTKRNLIEPWQESSWLLYRGATWPQKFASFAVVAFVVFLFLVAPRLPRFQDHYFEWRLTKANATDEDRFFRTRKFYAARLAKLSQLPSAEDPGLHHIMSWLRYPGVDRKLAEELLGLIHEYHAPALNRFTIPILIDALRTDNADMRLRVLQTLTALIKLDFAEAEQELHTDILKWVPSKSDSGQIIEHHVKIFRTWWDAVQKKTVSPPPSGSTLSSVGGPPPQALLP